MDQYLKKYCLYLAILSLGRPILANTYATEGSICQAGESIGRCVEIHQYPQFLRILRQRTRTNDETEFLLQHLCGNTISRKILACLPVRINDPGCGQQFTERIVKGQLSKLDEYPWMALFQYRKPRGQTGFHCGGALITKRYVLSAAHCFVGLRSGWAAIKVRLGEWDFEVDPDCTEEDDEINCAPPVQEIDLEQIIPHEGFSVKDSNKEHDIALVRLANEAIISNFVKPICLPEPGDVEYDSQLYDGIMIASGWGKTENSSSSRYKLYTKLWAVDYLECKASYSKALRIQLGFDQFCAGSDDGRDTCNGDSGGPLMKEVALQGRFYLAGLVSFGPKRCGEQLPGVYTKVEGYYKWIVSNVLESDPGR
ncbi:CLIP domain-containing serine protease B4-like [Malaya genurostris]|uniref:CLIP domain-containing serine protease B4-like n=1 Tax=Malaya genurostris TaxID=325434 RepID=UPI0026F3A27F|nr:CLIP domain-containing serine protease B4-like [Malaya genurostris]